MTKNSGLYYLEKIFSKVMVVLGFFVVVGLFMLVTGFYPGTDRAVIKEHVNKIAYTTYQAIPATEKAIVQFSEDPSETNLSNVSFLNNVMATQTRNFYSDLKMNPFRNYFDDLYYQQVNKETGLRIANDEFVKMDRIINDCFVLLGTGTKQDQLLAQKTIKDLLPRIEAIKIKLEPAANEYAPIAQAKKEAKVKAIKEKYGAE